MIDIIELRWFRNYLSNKRQLTVYNNCPSDIQRVDFGVRQGGDFLLHFLIYIDDIIDCSNLPRCVLCADHRKKE